MDDRSPEKPEENKFQRFEKESTGTEQRIAQEKKEKMKIEKIEAVRENDDYQITFQHQAGKHVMMLTEMDSKLMLELLVTVSEDPEFEDYTERLASRCRLLGK